MRPVMHLLEKLLGLEVCQSKFWVVMFGFRFFSVFYGCGDISRLSHRTMNHEG